MRHTSIPRVTTLAREILIPERSVLGASWSAPLAALLVFWTVLASQAQQGLLDFGDAPKPYPTLLPEGARHATIRGFSLGRVVDMEADGQPNFTATGDDAAPPGAVPDEDGVEWLITPLTPGTDAKIEVTASMAEGRLDAWVDFNADGDWEDPGERIFNGMPLLAGPNPLAFRVPDEAAAAATYARFRFSFKGGLPPFGAAPDGEVEDYQIKIERQSVDLIVEKGDAPDPVSAGDGLVYEIRVLNTVPVPATEVIVRDLLPPATTFVSATSSQGTCLESSGTVVCHLGTLGPQGSATIVIRVIPTASGLITNRVSVTSAEPDANPENNAASAVTRVTDRVTQDEPCDLSNMGTEYWLTFPGNYAPDPTNAPRVSLCIVGVRGTAGIVEIPGLSFSTNFFIDGSRRAEVHLPREADLGSANDLVEKKGIHVSANQPVAVYGFNRVKHTTDGYLGLPIDVLGRSYLVQAFANVHAAVPELNGSEFALVATEDATEVTIVPTVTVGSRVAGVPYQVYLARGETYQLRATNAAPSDVAGTLVFADKRVAVFGGHACANVPDDEVFFCDYLVEQLLPLRRAGTNFFTVPLATRIAGDTFRVLATQDGTGVSVLGTPVAILNRGESYQFQLSIPAQLTASRPVFLSQYANSSDEDGVVAADPFMVTIGDTSLHGTRYLICVPDFGYTNYFINVAAPAGAVALMRLDGVAVSTSAFVPIGSSGYVAAQLPVTTGVHSLTASDKFGAVVYGFSEYESYGYPAGLFFGDTIPPVITCPPAELTIEVTGRENVPCHAIVPDFTRELKVSDNCPLPQEVILRQEPPPGTPLPPGRYVIVITAVDAQGNSARCSVQLTVVDRSGGGLTLICPESMTVRCDNPEGAVVHYEAFAQTGCTPGVTVECTPPSGSFFPMGTTRVICRAMDATGSSQTCTFTVTVVCRTLDVRLTSSTEVTLTWSSGEVLEAALSITGPWTVIASGPSGSLTVPLEGRQRFFRVR